MKYILTEDGIKEIDHEGKSFSNWYNEFIDSYFVKIPGGYFAYYKFEYEDKVADTKEELLKKYENDLYH